MSDYYGWQPPSYHMYSGVSDDYAAERAGQSTPYEPTAWDSVNIEEMWEYVRKESDERTTALAEMWRRAASLLQATRDNLRRHADSLDAKWQSPAARVFMGRVGATLHSLDEWKTVATNNATGLDQLASKIKTTQTEMKTLWEEYRAEQIRQADRRAADEGIQLGDLFGINNGKPYDEVQKDYHQRAKNIVKPLADFYIDTYITNISRGGKFKGPTDAVLFDQSNVPRPTAPGAPGGRPGAPSLNGSRPNRPGMPNQPDTGDRPAAPAAPPPGTPDGLSLAGTTAPVAPAGPPPAAPPPVSTPNAPVTPGPPVPPVGPGLRPTNPGLNPPGSGRPNAPRTSLPGTGGSTPPGGRGPAPNRPTLPGAGGPANGAGAPPGGKRGPAPNRPTLPGNTGTPGAPGARPGRPGGLRPTGSPTPPPSSPQLPGSTARPGPRGAAPGRPATTPPPSLGGPRGAAPGKPPKAGAAPVSRAGTPPTPPPGTPTPGTGARPGLSGRTGATRPAPTTGPAPSLGGRRAGSSVPRPRTGQGRDGEQETWEYGDGDDELWVTESSAVGVVEAPTEQRPREQGRALGQS
ncbi:hypothetical protein [Micromonospora craniellae]|uniref:PPE domain-containing protein n=1 Tax=Micromonospora craniellae TaxID=2294034 RepID=A0A372FUK3_9ACTN|nr:hypothetical protein [Micromonospora craniellae]QOC95406.1 hypothetical protein ID554_16335 [Micromonospora craniellae]RFS44467.1 hypothetical protein D0Q02_21980 [Micromonospora craniellae]